MKGWLIVTPHGDYAKDDTTGVVYLYPNRRVAESQRQQGERLVRVAITNL